MKAMRAFCVIGLLLVIAAMPVMAAFTVKDSTPTVPTSIPFDLAGSAPTRLAFVRLSVAESSNGGPSWEINELDITVSGTIATSDIDNVYVYYEPQDGGTTNDGQWSGGADETQLAAVTTPIWSGNTITVPLSANSITFAQAGNGNAFVYAVFDLIDEVTRTKEIAVQIENIDFRQLDLSNPGTAAGPFPSTGVTSRVDDYEVTVLGNTAALGLTTAPPGTTVTALRLDFDVPDVDLAAADIVRIDAITFNLVGTGDDNDIVTNTVRVFSDDDLSGTFTVGDTVYGTGTFGVPIARYAEVTLTTPITLSDTDTRYFVAMDIRSDATVGQTLGLRLEAPITDIQFADSVTDVVVDPYLNGLGGVWAGNTYVTSEYAQTGFIDSANPVYEAPTPASVDTITIEEAEDTTPPTVVNTSPENAATGVSRTGTIQVIFSEAMATIAGGTVTISGSESGAISTIDDGTFTFNTGTRQSFTFAKTDPYVYEEVVTVTVPGSVTDNSSNLNAMGTDYVFTFTIEPESFPTVLATSPSDGATDVSTGTLVSVTFSEPMEEASVTDEANFSLIANGETVEVAGAMTYNASANTATFTPDGPLDFSTTYTGTVGVGVIDAEGSSPEADSSFSFTTASAAGSIEFTDIIVANNRITPGSTDPMRIFIETPAGASETDLVTIAVFTSSGSRVATLTTGGETFADVIARQPIVWDGTNGRGQPLGPGLYFVQVSSGQVRRALRVMIVR